MKNKILFLGFSSVFAVVMGLIGAAKSSPNPSLILKADELQNRAYGELTDSNLRVVFSIKSIDHEMGDHWTQPVADVYENGILVGSLRGAERPGFNRSSAHVQIVDLDQSNQTQELLLSSFTGGAHCCGTVHVLTKNNSTKEWQDVDLGPFDGGTLTAMDPLKGDRPLIFTRDNRFLYRFASYAGSAAPAQLWQLQNGSFIDVTHNSIYRNIHLKNLVSLEKTIQEIPHEGYNPNGVLAAYVATKAILGQASAAWSTMLDLYDPNQDWGLEECRGGYDKSGNCREKVVYNGYPEALLSFLLQTRYISAADASDIRSITIK